MRIAVTNPNTSTSMSADLLAAAKRAASPDAEIVVGCSALGRPDAIEGTFDGALAVPGMLRAMQATESQGADAHVIACFDDTGPDAARAALERPVVGIGEVRGYQRGKVHRHRHNLVTLGADPAGQRPALRLRGALQ